MFFLSMQELCPGQCARVVPISHKPVVNEKSSILSYNKWRVSGHFFWCPDTFMFGHLTIMFGHIQQLCLDTKNMSKHPF